MAGRSGRHDQQRAPGRRDQARRHAQQAKDIPQERRESLKTISEILLKRETIEREYFEALLEYKTEEEVFGDALVVPRRLRKPVPFDSADHPAIKSSRRQIGHPRRQ